jgi:hypothetical protein
MKSTQMNSLNSKFVYRVQHGWIGEPHRDLDRDFDTRRAAEEFQAKWLAGGKTRHARKPRLLRVRKI